MDISLSTRTGIILLLFWKRLLAFVIFVVFNAINLLTISLSNVFKMIIHGSTHKNERLEIYDLSYIQVYWKVVNQDITKIHHCFDTPVFEDVINLTYVDYDYYLNYVKDNILPVASQQTQNYAEYLTEIFGTSYKTLWQIMKLHFDYVPTQGLTSKVVMPNAFWHNAIGNGEDHTLFMSSILVNWGISHYLCYDVYLEKSIIYIRTEDNLFIDANSVKFGELDEEYKLKFLNHYEEYIEVQKV